MFKLPRNENTHAVACAPTWWTPSSADLDRAVAELVARRGDLAMPALGVVVVDRDGSRARVVVGTVSAVTVGRHCATDVGLGRADSSLRHLLFARDGDDVTAFDLGSTHGSSAASARAAADVPLIVTVGDTVVVACCVGAGATFPRLTPAMVRDAQPLRVRLVVPEMRVLPTTPPLQARATSSWSLPRCSSPPPKSSSETRHVDPWAQTLFTGQLPLSALCDLTEPLLIGRQPRNDLVLVDDRVSRVHAVVLPPGNDGRPLLVDAGSTNGTTVIRHGRPLELGPAGRCALLAAGDVIELGDTRLHIVGPSAPDAGGDVVYDVTRWQTQAHGGEA